MYAVYGCPGNLNALVDIVAHVLSLANYESYSLIRLLRRQGTT